MNQSTYSRESLKRNAWHYLSGKAVSGAITLVLLLVLVRVLSLREYGALVVFLALSELGYAIAGLGLNWSSARYLPEYQLHGSGINLKQLCYRLIGWQSAALFIACALAAVFGQTYLTWAGLEEFRSAGMVYIMIMLTEGISRFLREPVMGPLMLQKPARISLVSRQFSYLALLIAALIVGYVDLNVVVWIELIASILSLLVAGRCLHGHLNRQLNHPASSGWSPPNTQAIWSVARSMYFAHLISLSYSPNVLANMIVKWLGAEAVAVFGFLRALNDQISRYLPAMLTMSLLRPKMVASHVAGAGIGALASIANLAGKLSLFVLMPVLVVFGVFGSEVISLISGGKFLESGGYALGFFLGLIPFSQRHLLESVAVTLERSELCLQAATSGILMIPLAWFLLDAGLGLWGPIASIILGHLLFNTIILFNLRRSERYYPDWLGATKLVVCAILTFVIYLPVAGLMDSYGLPSLLNLAMGVFLIFALFLGTARILRPFREQERVRINSLIKRNLFIW